MSWFFNKFYWQILSVNLLACWTLQAQATSELFAHFDKPFYVAGEDAWYKIYFKNKIEGIDSEVLRVEWVSPNGAVLIKQKLKIQENFAVGDLAVPYDWREGNYQFRAYTVGEMDAILQQVVPIYNLQETPKILEDSTNLVATHIENRSSSLIVNLKTDKANYSPRDSITLIISVNNQQGQTSRANLSMAVTDGNYLPKIGVDGGGGAIENKMTTQFAAEKGLTLKGFLEDKEGKAVNTRFLTLFFPKRGVFQQTIVKDGHLDLQLFHFEGEETVQIFDMNPFHEPIPIATLEEPRLPNNYLGKPLVRSESVANYLFLLSKYRLYRETFRQPAPDYQIKPTVLKKEWTPDKIYQTEKYKGLSDLTSFTKEIISQSRVANIKGQPSIRLRLAEKSTFNSLSPWYLVNGWLTTDETAVLKMPFRAIEKIDMFNSKKRIADQLDPAMVSRGLLAIQTKDGKTPATITKKPNNLTITGYYPIRQFPKMRLKSTNSPDFRPLIYWQPNIQANSNGKATVRFTTSDAIGTHSIVVKGIGENGEIFEKSIEYKVGFKKENN